MSTLKQDLNLARPDDVYNLIADAHRELTPAQSEALNAALVLLLANHIGDEDVIRAAVAAARKAVAEQVVIPSAARDLEPAKDPSLRSG